MKKIKQVFPSRNYITIDSFGDVEVVFNPVGDGFEGDDKLMFRKGRWAFRVNDFLSGKVMPDGSKEGMGRKVYSLNLVYDDKDGEPIVNTTYVDPTSVIPLDGSIVDVVGSEKLAQKSEQEKISGFFSYHKTKKIDLSNIADGDYFPPSTVFVFPDRKFVKCIDGGIIRDTISYFTFLGHCISCEPIEANSSKLKIQDLSGFTFNLSDLIEIIVSVQGV